jgi:hypothetical protein
LGFLPFSHAEVFITEMSPQKAFKVASYRGRLVLKTTTYIFQVVFNICIPDPPS